MTDPWVIIGRLQVPKKLGPAFASFDFMMTQHWNGAGWEINALDHAKQFATKKDAEAEAVGVAVSVPVTGWSIEVLPLSEAEKIAKSGSVEYRIAE